MFTNVAYGDEHSRAPRNRGETLILLLASPRCRRRLTEMMLLLLVLMMLMLRRTLLLLVVLLRSCIPPMRRRRILRLGLDAPRCEAFLLLDACTAIPAPPSRSTTTPQRLVLARADQP